MAELLVSSKANDTPVGHLALTHHTTCCHRTLLCYYCSCEREGQHSPLRKSPPTMSLPSLPTELKLMIANRLGLLDKHTFGLTSRHYRPLISPPTYEERSLEVAVREATQGLAAHLCA